jgi:hypothetical protein
VLSDFDGSRSLRLSVLLVPADSLNSNNSLEAAIEDGIILASVEERREYAGLWLWAPAAEAGMTRMALKADCT